MTDQELQEIERAVAATRQQPFLAVEWKLNWVPDLLAEVKRIKEENRKLQVEAIDWESRVRSEREACAKVAEKYLSGAIGIRDAETYDWDEMLEEIATAIRARGGA